MESKSNDEGSVDKIRFATIPCTKKPDDNQRLDQLESDLRKLCEKIADLQTDNLNTQKKINDFTDKLNSKINEFDKKMNDISILHKQFSKDYEEWRLQFESEIKKSFDNYSQEIKSLAEKSVESADSVLNDYSKKFQIQDSNFKKLLVGETKSVIEGYQNLLENNLEIITKDTLACIDKVNECLKALELKAKFEVRKMSVKDYLPYIFLGIISFFQIASLFFSLKG